MFVLLEDGISYVVDADGRVCHDPGGAEETAEVPERRVAAVIAAAEDCPGECIFLEVGDDDGAG